MSSEQQFQDASDLRGAAQDYKRDAAHKHKWSNVAIANAHGRLHDKPKPQRSSRSIGQRPKNNVGKSRNTQHNNNILGDDHGHSAQITTSDESGVSADEDHEAIIPFGNPLYVASSGSQILNTALARAIEQYEDKETTKLVKKEWEVVDDDNGEDLGLSPVKKGPWNGGKGTVIPAEDQEYEFV